MSSLFPPHAAPLLPEFRSLLINGPYHASALIHLILSSHSNTNSPSAVILTPCRQRYAAALQRSLDDWLMEHLGHGEVIQKLLHANVQYPATAAEFALLLSMLRVPSTKSSEEVPWQHPKTTLHKPPRFIILHEVSTYFLQDGPWTLSSYLSLLAHGFAALTRLSVGEQKISLVLFDSRLHELRLPLVRIPSNQLSVSELRTEHLEPLVSKFFDWSIHFSVDEVDLIPAPQDAFMPNTRSRARSATIKQHETGNTQAWSWTETRLSAHWGADNPISVLRFTHNV